MKKALIIATAALFLLSLATGPAIAGSKERHRWEGVAIGIGAAILGSAIINNCQSERVTVIERYTYHRPGPPQHIPKSCETRRIWVSPTYKKVWNPGHYEYGKWIPGEYIMIEKTPGYWTEERICRNYR